MPDIRIRANKPPINPPLILSKLDLIRSIKRKKVVALREVILIKAREENGFNNIKVSFYYLL